MSQPWGTWRRCSKVAGSLPGKTAVFLNRNKASMTRVIRGRASRSEQGPDPNQDCQFYSQGTFNGAEDGFGGKEVGGREGEDGEREIREIHEEAVALEVKVAVPVEMDRNNLGQGMIWKWNLCDLPRN